jgi:hypothetical protein
MTDDEHLTEEEIGRRRDEVVKRMLATPPQPRLNPVKTGQKKASPPASGKGTA